MTMQYSVVQVLLEKFRTNSKRYNYPYTVCSQLSLVKLLAKYMRENRIEYIVHSRSEILFNYVEMPHHILNLKRINNIQHPY